MADPREEICCNFPWYVKAAMSRNKELQSQIGLCALYSKAQIPLHLSCRRLVCICDQVSDKSWAENLSQTCLWQVSDMSLTRLRHAQSKRPGRRHVSAGLKQVSDRIDAMEVGIKQQITKGRSKQWSSLLSPLDPPVIVKRFRGRKKF